LHGGLLEITLCLFQQTLNVGILIFSSNSSGKVLGREGGGCSYLILPIIQLPHE